ncbi:predicted protein [Bathycoccus prasinos]|uniref:SKP1-like protein n=1 Tax=Bathycoccus prasinos TaxID=41875 RepID=K8EHS1_9CHLO|nr:predicted protein [Bathycoccus prasinos]CCO17576.1 predicted protein [Bathycoccus prasinos]|eukprot:XP_007511455.1 predicted protein [Bathycoccus prasinos]
MPRPTNDKITLISAIPEQERFEVSTDVAKCVLLYVIAVFFNFFAFVKNARDRASRNRHGEKEIPLPNVAKSILQKVITYCEYHANAKGEDGKDKSEDDKKNFDLEYVKVDQATLFELILAANYLDIKDLLDLCCQTVANMIKGKTPAEIRKTFNIKNDFTPEEEEEVRKENQWAFE